jgi:hypothetical protein
MMKLVPLDQVDNVWPTVMPWVEQACLKARSNRFGPQIYAQCRNGALWLAVAITGPTLDDIVGVAILDISEARGERLLQHVIVAGIGDPEEWITELIEWNWVSEMGVVRVVTEGRSGWPRRVKHIVPSIKVVRSVFEWKQSDVAARKN